MQHTQEDRYFYCYNKNVSQYLLNKGFRYIHIAREIKTGNIFSLYKVTDDLSQALKEYKATT